MRKTLERLLLASVIILVSSNVLVSRDEDRSPPGNESKMYVADLQHAQVDCQVQDYQEQGHHQVAVAETPAMPAPAQDIRHPDNRWEVPRPTDSHVMLLLPKRRTNTIYRWGEVDHPVRQ